MTFLDQEDDKIHCILFKTTFEIPLVLIKEISEQTVIFNYYKYGYYLHDQQMRPSRNSISCGHICC